MKKLILAGVSAFALSLAGAGIGLAAQPANLGANAPATNMSQTNAPNQQAQNQTAPMRLSKSRLEQVQQKLKTAGLYEGRIDGVAGRKTKEALAKFQRQNDLQQTGRLDRQTLAALNQTTNRVGSSSDMQQPSNAGGSQGAENQNQNQIQR
jgi:N-acetylmuramoyl-L-alanine amidase